MKSRMRFLVGFVIMVAGTAFGGRGALCVTIDDRNLKNWEQTIPVFEKYGAHATFFVCGAIDTDVERCLRLLSKAGHSIGLHGLRHQKVTDLVAKEGEEGFLKSEIFPQLNVCRAKGLPVRSFAYPMSARTEKTDQLLLRYFDRLRGGGGAFKRPFPIKEAAQRRVLIGLGSVGIHNTGAKVAAMLPSVAADDTVLVLYTHGVLAKPTTHCTSIQDLELILSTAKSLDIPVIGFDELPKCQ